MRNNFNKLNVEHFPPLFSKTTIIYGKKIYLTLMLPNYEKPLIFLVRENWREMKAQRKRRIHIAESKLLGPEGLVWLDRKIVRKRKHSEK